LKPGLEKQFTEGWDAVTRYYLENAGSLGSRLHKGDDDVWYAYAQWPSEDARSKAFSSPALSDEVDKMKDAISERLPEVHLAIVSDQLNTEQRKMPLAKNSL
jgi:hypothetical protein